MATSSTPPLNLPSMFNLPRFGKFLRWLWHRSPLWYVFAPVAACAIIAAFVYFSFGATEGAYKDLFPHFDMEIIMPFAFMSMLLSGLPIAIHFASRHLAKPQEGIAYLSLPVSTLERFIALLLGLFIIIPVWSYLGLIIFYSLLNLFSGLIPYPFPGLADALPIFNFAFVPYLAAAVLVMGITIIRPRQAFVWYAGVGIAISILFPLFGMQAEGVNFILEMPAGPSNTVENLVGRQAPDIWYNNTSNFAMNNIWTLYIPAVVATLSFAAVAFLGLRHKQV